MVSAEVWPEAEEEAKVVGRVFSFVCCDLSSNSMMPSSSWQLVKVSVNKCFNDGGVEQCEFARLRRARLTGVIIVDELSYLIWGKTCCLM